MFAHNDRHDRWRAAFTWSRFLNDPPGLPHFLNGPWGKVVFVPAISAWFYNNDWNQVHDLLTTHAPGLHQCEIKVRVTHTGEYTDAGIAILQFTTNRGAMNYITEMNRYTRYTEGLHPNGGPAHPVFARHITPGQPEHLQFGPRQQWPTYALDLFDPRHDHGPKVITPPPAREEGKAGWQRWYREHFRHELPSHTGYEYFDTIALVGNARTPQTNDQPTVYTRIATPPREPSL